MAWSAAQWGDTLRRVPLHENTLGGLVDQISSKKASTRLLTALFGLNSQNH